MKRRKERERQSVKLEEDEEGTDSSFVVASSSDDEEANEDLTLKIEQKAQRLRHARLLQNAAVSPAENGDIAMKKNETKAMKIESGDQSVITAVEQEAIKASETNESPEGSTVHMSDNAVLRKLLRGPRYFDPPDSNWGTCFNCGEGGHSAVNCKAGRRKRPCFVCGSYDHAAKQCTKARDCFICKKGGHHAKDCPEKSSGGFKSLVFCLKCGDSGHEMFRCKNSYSSCDLKEVQCYVCKEFGHLCCVDSGDGLKWEASCYRCGQLGHTGMACMRIQEETSGATTPSSCYKCGGAGHFARECTSSGNELFEETAGAATRSSCFKCGEEGHFARECTSSSKVRKKYRQLKSSGSRKEKHHMENGTAPPDIGKAHKRKKIRNDDAVASTSRKSKRRSDWTNKDFKEFPSKFKDRGVTTPKRSKQRGGWMFDDPSDYASPKSHGKSKQRGGSITEDPEEIYPGKFNNRWISPATPPRWKSYNNAGSSGSNGYNYNFQHRASRFNRSSINPPPRYDWW